MIRLYLLVLMVLGGGFSTPISAAEWSIGEEREVDAGWYAKYFANIKGWRVWRFESRDGVFCKAAKAAEGLSPFKPLGVTDSLFGGTPGIQISAARKYPKQWAIVGRHGSLGGEWRMIGEKFFTPWKSEGDELIQHDGERVEIHQETWEYPSIYMGLADERAIVDLAGLKTAISKLDECAASGK